MYCVNVKMNVLVDCVCTLHVRGPAAIYAIYHGIYSLQVQCFALRTSERAPNTVLCGAWSQAQGRRPG